MGRSQVVRQRILIPPYGGSNPPAPATHSGRSGDLRSPGESPGIPAVCGAFLGAETCVEASCTISGASSLERQCEVDYGTTVDDCCVFPGTYLGMGLNVRHALVKGSRLFHLNRDIEVELSDSRLIGTTAPSRQLGRRARSVLAPNGTFGSSLVTRSSQLASLLTTRRFGRSS